ncbi:MAG: 50S ribosomal protein L28 [Kiritimatiellia bacterium]
MPKVCYICNKGIHTGNVITRHGLPKAKGGIGLHTTGISRRTFLPNLQKIKIIEDGTVLTRRVCTRCIKSGKVVKA